MPQEQQQTIDIRAYIDMALRRKWYILIPLVISVGVSFGVYKNLPKIYRATTLILVQPQGVPEAYVRSTVTESVTSRLSTIGQEILSRTRLEKVITEFNLYADLQPNVPMESIIELMRRAIEVKVQSSPQYDRGQNTFSVSFEGKVPETVMEVTNKLATLFIEENVKVREMRAEKTADFLSKELSAMEDKLKRKEHEIRDIKERHMGQLPQQLDANLRVLERLQQQLQTTSESLRATEDRIILVRNQIEQMKERGRLSTSRVPGAGLIMGAESASANPALEDPIVTQWNQMNRDLATAQSKYTENHPDVIELKRKIGNLEPRMKELQEKQKSEREARLKEMRARKDSNAIDDATLASLDPATERLVSQYTDQYNEAQLEAKRLRGEEKNLKEQFAVYQRRIEETPKREQELSTLTRDYELLKTNYQSLLDKKIQAQMAENLERKQQGEQFKVLDPARVPVRPVRPDRNKILLIGTVIGLGLGLGLSWFRETLDQSFHTVAEVEGYLGLPVLVAIPNLKEERGLPYYSRGKKVA
jgi:polysaccharide chain length determinant protein (PEP-CTERM system associated)